MGLTFCECNYDRALECDENNFVSWRTLFTLCFWVAKMARITVRKVPCRLTGTPGLFIWWTIKTFLLMPGRGWKVASGI